MKINKKLAIGVSVPVALLVAALGVREACDNSSQLEQSELSSLANEGLGEAEKLIVVQTRGEADRLARFIAEEVTCASIEPCKSGPIMRDDMGDLAGTTFQCGELPVRCDKVPRVEGGLRCFVPLDNWKRANRLCAENAEF